MSESEESIRVKVTQKIGEVERAVESLQLLRKALLQKAYETKQSILNAFINERDSMQSKEVRLLGEVDSLHHSKDDAVVIQLSKLNQVLGCLRSCLQCEHPCGDCLEKYEDLDMAPIADISVEFNSANDQLKRAVYSAGSGRDASPFIQEDEDVTQWLLTPTNVERHQQTPRTHNYRPSDLTASTASSTTDSHVTEWLLQYHRSSGSSKSSPTAAGMGNIFSGVKQDDSENWLRSGASCKPSGVVYSHTNHRFEIVTAQPPRDWLIQTSWVVSPEVGESDVSSSTSSSSSAVSSYAIIPSSYASEVDYCGGDRTNYWLRHGDTSNNDPVNPAKLTDSVTDWIASCGVEESHSARNRLVSMSSLTSELLSIQADAERHGEWRQDSRSHGADSDWLLKSDTPKVTISGDNVSAGANWPNSNTSENSVWLMREPNVSWIAARTEKQQMTSDIQMEVEDEKHDVLAEKAENSEWLRRRDVEYGEMWLLSQKQKLSDSLSTERKTCQDRDWLMIVNTLSQISTSDSAGWLIKNQ